MFNPKFRRPLTVERSCSMDEAIARLLGWTEEAKRLKFIEITETGRSADQLPYINSFEGSIGELLSRLQEKADLEFNAAEEANAPEQVKVKKAEAAMYWRFEAARAMWYMMELSAEVSRGLESELPIDPLPIALNDCRIFIYLDSLDRWAQKKYGSTVFHCPERAGMNGSASDGSIEVTTDAGAQVTVRSISWEDVTVKIYADYRIGWKLGNDNYKKSSFRDIGLLGRLKNEPNELGGLLLGLSQNKKFPNGSDVEDKHKTAISKLRKRLLQLTGITGNPFFPVNHADGWKPRFKLIDDRRNAADRAKEKAVHFPLDEARDFDAEDDDTGEWLAQNDR